MNKISRIKLSVPSAPSINSIIPYLEMINKNKQYSNFGPLHDLLANRLATYFNVPENCLVLTCNATQAIAAAVSTSLQDNNIWHTPSWTFTATPAGIIQGGGQPHFIDRKVDWNADIKDGYKNVLDVLPFGDSINHEIFSRDYNNLIIDAAASFDSLRSMNLPIKIPTGVIVSLHATKLMSAGEGGVFITNDESWAKRVRSWSNFGFEIGSRISNRTGTNAKLSEYNCAVALASLDIWPKTRDSYVSMSNKAIEISNRCGFTVSPAMRKGLATPYWVAKFNDAQTKILVEENLFNMGIDTRDWWGEGCDTMQAYSKYLVNSLDNTKDLCSTTIGLPFHPELTGADLKQIESSILNAY